MRKAFLSILLALSAAALQAAPARRTPIPYTQPDGSTIVVYPHGDEFCHWLTDEAGQTVMLGQDGFYHVAEPMTEERVRARRAANPVYQARAHRTPSLNMAPRGLVILVNYADVQFQNTNAAMDSMMNVTGYSVNDAIGSVRDYFIAQSDSAYQPVFDVVGPVTLDRNRQYYGQNDADDNDMYPADFVIDACLKADALGVNFADYDNDHDNKVDFVYFIYAGEGEADWGGADTMWPINWDLSSALYWGCSTNENYLRTQQLVIDGKKIYDFAYSGEIKGTSGNVRNGIGTLCHEFSHVIGLPDYYDTTDGAGNNSKKQLTPGYWSLMDYGNYNMDGNVPPNYSVWDKWFVGWAEPALLTSAENVKLKAGEGRYITKSGVGTGAYATSKRYFVENRQQEGWDSGLPSHGMLVWRLDYNEAYWNNNQPNSHTYGQPHITIVPAQAGIVNDDGRDVFPGTGNITSWSAWPTYPITEISEVDGIIRFKFMGGVEAGTLTFDTEGVTQTSGPEAGSIEMGEGFIVTFIAASGYETFTDANTMWSVEVGGVEIAADGIIEDGILTIRLTDEQVTDGVAIMVYATKDVASGWQETGTPVHVRKTIRDGQLLMIRGEKTYNIWGDILYEDNQL